MFESIIIKAYELADFNLLKNTVSDFTFRGFCDRLLSRSVCNLIFSQTKASDLPMIKLWENDLGHKLNSRPRLTSII